MDDATPSSLQLALAVAVLRSKPDRLSLRDHILNLRRQLKVPPLYSQQSPRWVVDQISFWKSEYERIECEKADLQARYIDLERRSKSSVIDPDLDVRQQTTKTHVAATAKRKKAPAATEASNKKSKLKHQTTGLSINGSGPTTETAADFDLLSSSSKDGLALVQGVYGIQHYTTAPQTNDAEALCYNLSQTATSIGSLLAGLPDQQSRGSPLDDTAPAPVAANATRAANANTVVTIKVAARAFSTVLHGLSYLSAISDDTKLRSTVIYSCAKAFRRSIKAISVTCAAAGGLEKNNEHASGKSRTSTGTADLARAICQFLCATLTALQPHDSAHVEIFEAFMYVLLDRVGSSIYQGTFEHSRGATVEDDVCMSSPPTDDPSTTLAQETPFLVTLLEKGLSVAQNMYSTHPSTTSKGKAKASRSQTTVKKASTSGKTALSRHARERLQQTLVNSIFGSEESKGRECLTMPVPRCTIAAPPKDGNGNRMYWFREEIWRLVGWDVLAAEHDF